MSELKVNRITDTDGNEVLKSTSGTWTTSLGILNVNGGSVSNSTLSNSTLSNNTISESTLASTNTFPAGHVIQIVEMHDNSYKDVSSNSAIKLYDIQIVTKQLNSEIYVMVNVGRSATNSDIDMALAIGYKEGATSTSSSDYTSLHGTSYSRQQVTSLGSFWAQDTADPGGGSWSGRYGIYPVIFTKIHAPGVSAGTTLSYSLWGSTENGLMRIGNSYNTGGNGYDNSITLMEISNG